MEDNGLLRERAPQGAMSARPPAGNMDGMDRAEGADDEGAENPNVSPEEQAQYERFMDNAFKLIYHGGKVSPAVLESLGASGDPKMNLAHTAVNIVLHLQDSARKANKDVSPDVLFQGGKDVVEDLANLAGMAGIHKFDQDELEGAWYQALDLYREAATRRGLIDPDAIKQDFDTIVQADRAGNLDKLLPGIGRYAAQSKSSGMEQRNG